MTIRGLMIDVDGVLVRGRPADGNHWASTIEADLGVSQVDVQRALFTPYWRDIIVGQMGLHEALATALPTIAAGLSPQRFIDYWFANDARLDEQLLKDVGLQRERGVRVFLATNQEHLRATYLIENLGLGDHCDGIYYSGALGCCKPDKRFFEKAAALAGIPADGLLLIDDRADNVAAAKIAGWRALQWMPDSRLEAELDNLLTASV